MKEIIASPNRVLHLGYEGEDNVTLIKFPYDDTWLDCGDGEFKIRVLRHGDTEAYNATEVIDNRESMTLTMTVTDIELSVRGRGELQLVYVCSGAIKKSEIYQYNVYRSIDSEVVSPPDGSIIASVEESLAEIKDEIGSLSELTTTDKSSLVSAINEVNAKESGGGSVTVDDELSGTSENPVQNKVVKARFDSVDQTVAGIGGRLATTERLGSIIVGEDLQITPLGVLSVVKANRAEPDNTHPITAAAVFTEIGNINALLQTI
jgi:hypothetical protein